MNRNTILYILIGLLVVLGGAWYAFSSRTADETERNNVSEETQDVDNGDEESVEEDADGETVSFGNTDTGSSISINGETSNNSTTSSVETVGVGGSSQSGDTHVVLTNQKELIRTELSLQLEVVDSILKVVELQLESGDISVEDADEIVSGVAEVVKVLEASVEAYLAL